MRCFTLIFLFYIMHGFNSYNKAQLRLFTFQVTTKKDKTKLDKPPIYMGNSLFSNPYLTEQFQIVLEPEGG